MCFPSFYLFCFSVNWIHAKNSIKTFMTVYFFSPSSNSVFLLFSSTSFNKKFSMSPTFFVLKLQRNVLSGYYQPETGNLHLPTSMIILFHSSFWFRLDLLLQLLGIIISLLSYILHQQDRFFMALVMSKPSSLNLATHFLYFSIMFWILSFSVFISIGLISASFSKLSCPRTEMKSITFISLFLFLLVCVNWKLSTISSVGSIYFCWL